MTGAESARARPLRPTDARELGAYELLGRLGEGGMGTVYLGRTADGRLVAIKVIRTELAEDSEFRRRFRSEVNRARQVPSFCTAEVLGADPDHDPPYLVVEYVDGPSLADVVRDRGPLTPANLHGMAIGVAAALTAIHGAGVIHRDLKPSNVLLAPGSPKVIDFGIARPVDPTTIFTETDQVVGTVAYMSPERLASNGREISPAADVFAWGAVVAYAGNGRIPFAAESLPAVALRILHDPPDLGSLSGSLGELVGAALEKSPADRPTARELLDRLTATGPRGAPVPLGAVQAAAAGAGTRPAGATVTGVLGGGTRAAPTEVVSLPSAPRRAALALLALAVAVVTLTLAIVGVATGVIGRPDAAGGQTTPPPGPATGVTATPTATASPTPSATVGPSVTPTGLPLPAGVVLIANDDLSKPIPLRWEARPDNGNGGTCAFDGGLVVALTKENIGSFRCPGPKNQLADLAVFVDVTLLTPTACAAIWYRFESLEGYALLVCPERIRLVTHGAAVTTIYETPLTTRIDVNKPVRVGLTVEGRVMRFYRDGVAVGQWSSTLFDRGRVYLGVFQRSDQPPPYSVKFANIELYGAGA